MSVIIFVVPNGKVLEKFWFCLERRNVGGHCMSGLYDATEDRDANVFEINEVTNTHNRAGDMALSRHMIILLFI